MTVIELQTPVTPSTDPSWRGGALAPSRTIRPQSISILRDAANRPLLRSERKCARPVDEELWSIAGDIAPLNFLFVLAVGLLAGTISGIVGTGSSIMLMPVLVYQYGPKEAVPIMAVAAVMANLSRILAWWREVDWRACAA
jgi:hypothetical protein